MTASALGAAQRIPETYVKLMEELKERQETVRTILIQITRSQFTFAPSILAELCYLQLRMVCELIALACLLVHGDIKETRIGAIPKEWRAGELVKRLTRLHPDFYPVPTKQKIDAAGNVTSTEPISEQYLTKAQLLKLYAECGGILHRGNLETIASSTLRHYDFNKIARWIAEITNLLNHHQIALIDPRKQIWVVMKAKEDGRVHYHPMVRYDGPLLGRNGGASANSS